RVVRAQPEQVLVRVVRVICLAVRLVRGREIVPGVRVLGMSLRLLERALHRRAVRRAAFAAEDVEVAAQEVAETGRAGADPEEDETGGEDEGEKDEHPLGLSAQA